MLIFFKWLCAHLLGDFTFQTRTMVLQKRQHKALSGYLYLHVGIYAALIYLFTGWWTNWQLPLIVAITHFGIDWWKLYRRDTLFYFALDQFLHVAVLGGLWWWYQAADRAAFLSECHKLLNLPSLWIITSAYIFIIWPCALVLGYLTRRWRDAVERRITPEQPPQGGPGDAGGSGNPGSSGNSSGTGNPSLSEAGKWIGIFERTLVLTFILTNHYEGIGFLIAAKSILRFGEIKGKERAEAEYILIGTLMSFSASILTGMLCRYLLLN